jgi:hypothetical protein
VSKTVLLALTTAAPSCGPCSCPSLETTLPATTGNGAADAAENDAAFARATKAVYDATVKVGALFDALVAHRLASARPRRARARPPPRRHDAARLLLAVTRAAPVHDAGRQGQPEAALHLGDAALGGVGGRRWPL